MKITYSQIKALNPCWTDKALNDSLPGRCIPVEVTEEKLLNLSRPDCRWLLARILSEEKRIIWAKECANRAKQYAADAAAYAADAAAYAAYAAAAAADAAAYAAYAAAYAAAAAAAADAAAVAAAAAAAVAAAAAAAADAEHKKAIQHALQLLG